MVVVQAPPFDTFTVEFQENQTVGELIQQITDEHSIEFKGNYTIQSAADGHACALDEIVLDERIYNLNAWIVRRA